MAFSYTVDERYSNSDISHPAGEHDASATTGTSMVLAADSFGYGALVHDGAADVDVYALGELAQGRYTIRVLNDTWDPASVEDASVMSISVLDSNGAVIGTSNLGGLEIDVYDVSSFYLRIDGGDHGSAQYRASYTRTGDLPPDHVFSELTYTLSPMQLHLTLTGSDAIDGTGNALDNNLTGNAAANILRGEGGDDWLDGAGGFDTLFGGEGDDVLGGAGVDWMEGGTGDDAYLVNDAADRVVEEGDAGVDVVCAEVSCALAAMVEDLVVDSDGDVNGTGNGLRNSLSGAAGDNRLRGLDGDDLIRGFAGDDWLDGGAGSDEMRGGSGDDTFVVDSSLDRVHERWNEGVDLVRSSASFTLSKHVENLTLTGSGVIGGTGNASANQLRGNIAANSLDGGSGADLLFGGRGADRLAGGLASDELCGGGGADVFLFNSIADAGRGAKRDAITDFVVGKDVIRLSGIDADTEARGNQSFDFIGQGRFTGDAGELRYKFGVLSGDVTGDGAADFHIALDNAPSLTEGDFIL